MSCLLPKSRHQHMVLHQCKPAIYGASDLTTANLEARFAQQSAPALVTACGSDAHSFAQAARGCASGPARRMLGREDEHGCGTRDAGRWPWRASAGVIKSTRAGLFTVRWPWRARDRPHYIKQKHILTVHTNDFRLYKSYSIGTFRPLY